MPAAVTDLPTALLTGLAAGLATLISAIPSILGALLILLLGWIITGALAGALARALRAVRVNAAADRAGVRRVLQRAQVRGDAAGVIAGVVKWYLRLIVILVAADAVKLTAVSTIVNQILAFVPTLLVAVLILAAFSWLATLARNLVTAALEPTMPNAKTIGVLAYGATFGFGVLAAATQIGVAATLLNILFIGIVGALALAFGLAFGLGGREEAARMWREMNGAVGNVVKEGAPAAANAPGTGASGSTINVMSLWGASEQDNFQKVLDAFKTKTGVTAKYESIRTDYATTLQTRISGGNPPDVAIIPGIGFLRQFAKQGSLKKIADLGLDVNALKSNYPPGILEIGQVDGTQYAIMVKFNSKSTVWFRPDKFKTLGVTAPTDFAGFTKLLGDIKAKGQAPLGLGAGDSRTLTDWFESVYVRQAGPDKYDQLFSGKLAWTDASVATAIDTKKQALSDQYVAGR